MKPDNNLRSESGQVLLILTVGIVALLGMLALAIDGGMIYSDRRFDQNAADASAFAGAGAAAVEMTVQGIDSNNFTCAGALLADGSPSNTKMGRVLNSAIAAAQLRAVPNNFPDLPYPLEEDYGIEVSCFSSGEQYIQIRVVISTDVPTAFAHLFYKGRIRNTVEAIARITTTYKAGGDGSLTHLSTDCESPLRFSGDALASIDGAYSNGCMRRDGMNLTVTSTIPFTYRDLCKWPGSVSTDAYGCPNTTPDADPKFPDVTRDSRPNPMPKFYLEDVYSSSAKNTTGDVRDFWTGSGNLCGPSQGAASFNSSGTLDPGRYSYLSLSGGPSTKLTLTGGLYCFDGNFDVLGSTTIEGNNVTIIMLGGSLSIGGNATAKLSASAEGDMFKNVLFYSAKFNTSTHNFAGTGATDFDGTIWSPDGHVKLVGTGAETSFDGTQVIANQITVTGTNDLKMIYDPSKALVFPSQVSLIK